VGFLDHMLTHIARHGFFDLVVSARGDLEVDAHHTVEDVGICLGQAVAEAAGDGAGLSRYGHAVVPMDEALAEAALDLSGRPFLRFAGDMPTPRVGAFDAELGREFFQAFVNHARATLHIELRAGKNTHHCLEAVFKAFGRALDRATRVDPRLQGALTTKGVL
jgi:imidazoleglycerol-phosphate dehydratase